MENITTLDNGLKISSVHMPDTDTVSLSIWVKTGSRNETEKQNGISHFLEHMAFKGTSKRSAKEIAETFDNIGGFINAATSREHTIYYTKVLKDNVSVAIDVLSDIIQNSVFDKEELERERGVILQEIAMTNDTPDDIVFDYFQETAYQNQALGRSILGPIKNVSNFNSQDLVNFIQSQYSSTDMLFSVAGKITANEVEDLAQKYFTSLKKFAKAENLNASYTGGSFIQNRDLEQVHLLIGFEGISYLSQDIYAIQLLSILLGGGMSSRLFQEVREKRGLAYSVYSFQSTYRDTGLFSIYASTDPKDMNQLIQVVSEVINNATLSISEEELIRAKNQAKAALLMGYESSSFRADEMGRNISCLGRNISKQETIHNIDLVRQEDIVNLLKKITTGSKPTLTALGKVDGLMDYSTMAKLFA